MAKRLFFLLCLWGLILPLYANAAENHAVVFMYHRFGEDSLPSTNTTIDQLKAHIAELKRGPYTVMPLSEIVEALQSGKELPDYAVGLSVDDAFLSLYQNAWPLLKEARLPFTLFVATGSIDERRPGYMDWDMIRELRDSGLVTIGSQTETHPQLWKFSPVEVAQEIIESQARFADELGKKTALIAYPYGEYSLAVARQMKSLGFAAAFGQHSGVIHEGSDFFALPRFAMNETYGDPARFREAARALPLPVKDLSPADPVLSGNMPAIGFSILPPLSAENLTCYASDQGKIDHNAIGKRIETRLAKPWDSGRARINCTQNAGDGRYRWFGAQYIVP